MRKLYAIFCLIVYSSRLPEDRVRLIAVECHQETDYATFTRHFPRNP
jgi:hypothetical protein